MVQNFWFQGNRNPILNCDSDYGEGFPARLSDSTTGANSALLAELNLNSVHAPLVREYSMGIQYEFVHGWVLDWGYVGSSGINLNDYNHDHNQAMALVTSTNSLSYLCNGGTPDICNTAGNAQFRVPYAGYSTFGLQSNDNSGYSNYNSLQVTVRHQFSHGLSMHAAYTWDKDLSTIFCGNTANVNPRLNRLPFPKVRLPPHAFAPHIPTFHEARRSRKPYAPNPGRRVRALTSRLFAKPCTPRSWRPARRAGQRPLRRRAQDGTKLRPA